MNSNGLYRVAVIFSSLALFSLLLSGCILFQGAANQLVVTITPGSGPSGTPADVKVTGAQPGDAIIIQYSDGRSSVAGVADANGEFLLPDTFNGNVGDVIRLDVTATSPSGTQTGTASATFTITDTPNIQDAALGQDNLQAVGASPTISVSPDKGPTGTQATITIRGAGPNQPVTIKHSGGAYPAQTDENGVCVVQDTFTGQVGDVITIEADIGAANEHQVSTTFTITAPLDQACSGDDCELQDQGAGPTISVNPSKGPTGTTATITITGGTPGHAVTLHLNPGTTQGVIDANGNFTCTHTFYGQVGDKILIEAHIGPQNNYYITTEFEITAPLEQVFNCTSGVFYDPLSHVSHVALPAVDLLILIRPGSLIIEGTHPWVSVTGELGEDGSFSATGSGTVAGYPDITVTFEGTVSMTHLEGKYSMGTEGGLPGGLPITYSIEGQPNLEDEEISGADRVEAFFNTFNMAQQNEEVEEMLDILHPAVFDLYGAETCETYLGSIINPSVEIEVLAVTSFGPWDWEIDGITTRIENAFSVEVSIHSDQADTDQVIHIAQRPDGTLGWFTDCGDPE